MFSTVSTVFSYARRLRSGKRLHALRKTGGLVALEQLPNALHGVACVRWDVHHHYHGPLPHARLLWQVRLEALKVALRGDGNLPDSAHEMGVHCQFTAGTCQWDELPSAQLSYLQRRLLRLEGMPILRHMQILVDGILRHGCFIYNVCLLGPLLKLSHLFSSGVW